MAREPKVKNKLTQELSKGEHQVQFAATKKEALKLIRKKSFHLVIMDNGALIMEGFLTIFEMFNHYRHLKFLLIFSRDYDSDFLNYFKESGIDHRFIETPNSNQVLTTIEGWL